MEKQTVIIELKSDIDPSTLLDLAITAAEKLVEEIENHGEEVLFDENDVAVHSGDE